MHWMGAHEALRRSDRPAAKAMRWMDSIWTLRERHDARAAPPPSRRALVAWCGVETRALYSREPAAAPVLHRMCACGQSDLPWVGGSYHHGRPDELMKNPQHIQPHDHTKPGAGIDANKKCKIDF